ncbi:unnamed protein product [Rhizophagus irregularis]|nr:unnamed protein product [Rhizophagus irregularis]
MDYSDQCKDSYFRSGGLPKNENPKIRTFVRVGFRRTKTQRFVRVGFRRTKTQRFVRVGFRRTKTKRFVLSFGWASEERKPKDSYFLSGGLPKNENPKIRSGGLPKNEDSRSDRLPCSEEREIPRFDRVGFRPSGKEEPRFDRVGFRPSGKEEPRFVSFGWASDLREKRNQDSDAEEYPNGMRRTSFMTCLESGQYVYRENLGGLCSTCNDCGYIVFGDIGVIISAHVMDEPLKVKINFIKICKYEF